MFEIVALMLLTHQPLQPVAVGKASFYTVSKSGWHTASGERLNDDHFTCAMRNGVFGEYYLVVAENGKTVTCRLNDRGPYIRGRVIDLSQAAVKALGTNKDVFKVRVYRLGTKPPS